MRYILATSSDFIKAIAYRFRYLRSEVTRTSLQSEIETLARVTQRSSIVLSGISFLFNQNGTHFRDPDLLSDYHETLRLLSSLESLLEQLHRLQETSDCCEGDASIRHRAQVLLNDYPIDPNATLNRNQCYSLLEEKLCSISKKVRLKSRPLLQPYRPLPL